MENLWPRTPPLYFHNSLPPPPPVYPNLPNQPPPPPPIDHVKFILGSQKSGLGS